MKKYEFYWPEGMPKWAKIVLPVVVAIQVIVVVVGLVIAIIKL